MGRDGNPLVDADQTIRKRYCLSIQRYSINVVRRSGESHSASSNEDPPHSRQVSMIITVFFNLNQTIKLMAKSPRLLFKSTLFYEVLAASTESFKFAVIWFVDGFTDRR